MSAEQIQKHQIHQEWNFWYAPRGRNSKVSKDNNENYEKQLQNIGCCNSIEDFFSVYLYLKRPSEIPTDNKLMFFRSNCKPLWEAYPEGGSWILTFKKKDQAELNKKWELILFACIGEQFDTTQVIGVVLSRRSKRNLLEIWIVDSQDEDTKVKIGEKLRKILDMDYHNLTFFFKRHHESLQDQSMFKGIERYTFKTSPLDSPLQSPQTINQKISINQQELIDFKL